MSEWEGPDETLPHAWNVMATATMTFLVDVSGGDGEVSQRPDKTFRSTRPDKTFCLTRKSSTWLRGAQDLGNLNQQHTLNEKLPPELRRRTFRQ